MIDKQDSEALIDLIGELVRAARDCGFADAGYEVISQHEKQQALEKAGHDVAFAIAGLTKDQ